MNQEYYRRKLKANKLRRMIAYNRAHIRNFHVLLRFALIALLIFACYKTLNLSNWYIDNKLILNSDPQVLIIEGNNITPDYKIADLVRQVEFPQEQIFKLETTEIEEKILQLQPIKKVYVRRFWLPARLNILVEERTPILTLHSSLEGEQVYAITDDAVFIDREYLPLDERFKTYKVVTHRLRVDDHQNWNTKKVGEIYALANALETYSNQNVLYIDLRNAQDAYIKLDEVLIRFGEINSTALKRAKSLATILPELSRYEGRIKYLDLRWEDARYIKLDEKKQKEEIK